MTKLFFYVIIIITLACSKKVSSNKNDRFKNSKMNIVKTYSIPLQLDAKSLEKIKQWKQYNDIKEFLVRFKKISPNQALSNALELKDLAKRLKDSLNIKEFKTPAFMSRINVLENEALRLADMTYISAITSAEVSIQIKKILLVYGSLNSKIKAYYKEKSIDDNLKLENLIKQDSIVKKVFKNKFIK